MGTHRSKIGLITAERVRQLLVYDPATGEFRARIARGKVRVGDLVGWYRKGGYHMMCLDWRIYRSHRIAWLYVHGKWPSQDLDHKDGNPGNNCIENLREATDSQNLGNMKKPITNKSGRKGVSWHKLAGKWQVHIRVDGDNKYLGLYTNLDEAHAVYARAASQFRGEFGRAA